MSIIELKGSIETQKAFSADETIRLVLGILSLFRVGGIDYIRYYIQTDSILPWGLISAERIHSAKHGKYVIKNEDVKPLITFWSNMKNMELPIPGLTGERKEPNELSIAYERYSDSLDGGVVEKQISSAVMGLEALYLGGGEQQEMSYRLRARVGKILGLINYVPNQVSERLQDAYDVRSKYVHGGILRQKDRNKLESKYGDITEFSKTIIDYLRASIVALLKRPSKKSLINLLDESLLDSNKDNAIKEMLFTPY
ncbi:hypothetical protein ACFLW8_00805 [Chloroflexota bacterium]